MTNLKALKKCHLRDQLSLEELYILGLLIINNEPSTYKNIKSSFIKRGCYSQPIIKNCMPKDILIKVRSTEDERNIV